MKNAIPSVPFLGLPVFSIPISVSHPEAIPVWLRFVGYALGKYYASVVRYVSNMDSVLTMKCPCFHVISQSVHAQGILPLFLGSFYHIIAVHQSLTDRSS